MWYIKYTVSRTLRDKIAQALLTFALVYVFVMLAIMGALQ